MSAKHTYRRHGDVPAAMRDAALALIDEGYEPTLRECARRIGVSCAAPYRHFTDHDDLLETVTTAIVADMKEALTDSDDRAASFVGWAEANDLRFRWAIIRPEFPHEDFETIIGRFYPAALGDAMLVSLGARSVREAVASLHALREAACVCA